MNNFYFKLSKDLNILGRCLVFDANKADLSGISNNSKGLFISNIIHQNTIEICEEGTEAASVTGALLTPTMNDLPPTDFKCNRPFLFIIHDTINNRILFFGKYVKPE